MKAPKFFLELPCPQRNQALNPNDTPRLLQHGHEGAINTIYMRKLEIDRLRGQRLCFNYKERWQYNYKCKPKHSVVVIEGLEEDNEWQKQGNREP